MEFLRRNENMAWCNDTNRSTLHDPSCFTWGKKWRIHFRPKLTLFLFCYISLWQNYFIYIFSRTEIWIEKRIFEKKIQNLFSLTEISSTRIYVIEDRTGRWLLWWMSSLTKTHSIAYACCKFVIIPSTYQVVPRWVEP